MDAPQEVARCLVVARSYGAVLLQACKEVLNQMPSLVEVPVIFARLPVRGPRGNHHGLALGQQWLNQPRMGVVGLVCDDSLRSSVLEQDVSTLEIMGLPGREEKSRRIAQRIDRGMDLGAQAASAASEGLLVRIPPFAPALCWWARTMVASIIAYSLSASCAKASNTLCQTPLSLHRE